MKNKFRVSIVIVFLLVAACDSSGQKDVSEGSNEQQPTDPLSNVELTDLEGNSVKLDDFAGKTIVLNFWATWCKPCIMEMPSMEAASTSLGEGFIFLLASDEDIEKISKFREKQGIDLPFVQLQTGVQNLQITALPTTWIIRDGKVLSEIVGSREWDTQAHIEELKSL